MRIYPTMYSGTYRSDLAFEGNKNSAKTTRDKALADYKMIAPRAYSIYDYTRTCSLFGRNVCLSTMKTQTLDKAEFTVWQLQTQKRNNFGKSAFIEVQDKTWVVRWEAMRLDLRIMIDSD